MLPTLNTKDPSTVAAAVRAMFTESLPAGDWTWIEGAFQWAEDTFRGRQPGFQAVDTPYHDLEHTLQTTLCLACILHGRARAGAKPSLGENWFKLGIHAALFHDIGYLKPIGDSSGTGAKLTFTHVGRSAACAAELLRDSGFPGDQIAAVQRIIRCTGTRVSISGIPFASEAERIVGCALGTADLLGQMSAADYVDRLPLLYAELAEGAAATPHLVPPDLSLENGHDLRRRTPHFWRDFVLPRIQKDLGGLYRFLADPYPDGPNQCVEQIEANIARLEGAGAEEQSASG